MLNITRTIIIVAVSIATTMTSSCQERTSIQKLNEWVRPLTSTTMIDGAMPLLLGKDFILCLGQKASGGSVILKKSLSNGETLWECSNLFRDNSDLISFGVYEFNNILVVKPGASVLGIDINNGKILWRNIIDNALGSTVRGLGQYYLYGGYQKTFTIGNVKSGQERILDSVPDNPLYKYSHPNQAFVYINKTNDTLAILPYLHSGSGDARYILYNIAKQRQIYDQTIAPPSRGNSGIYGAEAYKGYAYFSIGFYFFCHRLSDGKQMWKKDMPLNIGPILVADDTFLGICQNDSLYAYHAVTGKSLWQTRIAGTLDKPFYMNGVYYVVGGDGRLYAVDGKTGKILWKRMSPDIDDHSDSAFKGNVVGANGKIYVSSYLNLYCFKAAR